MFCYNRKIPNKTVCWECDKPGHTRNQCRMKKKIKELTIPEQEKNDLIALLEKSDSEDNFILEIDSESESDFDYY